MGKIWTDTRLNNSPEGKTTGNSKALGLPVLPHKADGSFTYTQELLCCDYACGGLKPMSHLQKLSYEATCNYKIFITKPCIQFIFIYFLRPQEKLRSRNNDLP